MKKKKLVGIIMGSISDAPKMEGAREVLKSFNVGCDFKVVSAHRTPDEMFSYAEDAKKNGIEIIIAGAGGAAHLPGMIASKTNLPVIGVPIKTKSLNGIDSLLSIAQMPAGIPVATVAIDNSTNAGLLALRILGIKYPQIQKKLDSYKNNMRKKVLKVKV